MPTYTYKCQDIHCENRFEVERKITDDTEPRCNVCHGPVKQIIVPGGGFVLKGENWFKNSGTY